MARMSLTFAAAAADMVLTDGPLTLQQLHERGLAQGITKARAPSSLAASLRDDGRFVLRPDGRYDTAARLLVGAVLTTRLRRPVTDGVLWLRRDLDPMLALRRDKTLPLVAGGALRPGAGAAECWLGPPGWAEAAGAAPLLGLRWDGQAAAVVGCTPDDLADPSAVQDVRRLLSRHASAMPDAHWWNDRRPPLPAIVLSALVEEPELLLQPLPPLSELLPLPQELRPQDSWGRVDDHGVELLQVPMSSHVLRELERRADLLGERVADYTSMLLGAAADRLLPVQPLPVRDHCADLERYSDAGAWDDDSTPAPHRAEVVQLSRWTR